MKEYDVKGSIQRRIMRMGMRLWLCHRPVAVQFDVFLSVTWAWQEGLAKRQSCVMRLVVRQLSEINI